MDGHPTLDVPVFARLDEYAGLWLIEPQAAARLWQLAGALDLRAHVAARLEADAAQPPLKAAVEKVQAGPGKSIALLRAEGVLMKQRASTGGTSTIQLRRDLRQAAADPDVAGILLAIDSPGGTVAGTDDLAADVQRARQQKPVWAHIEDLGASAAYWVASQSERISANSPTALVGSIGTIQVIHDVSAAAEKEGIRTLVFSTGPLKGLGVPGARVTDDQASHVQKLVDSVQGSFDRAVQNGRKLSAAELAAVRHGGVMAAPQALQARLIDAIQPLGDALDQFARALGRSFDTGRRAGLPMRTLGRLPTLGCKTEL